ncbi:MAG: N-acetyl-gamma-glutamyl-phosphate reductase [Bacteroidia bacterium]|nr:N-acetyl-gamma-glutamyl-phosphate reductase [Bacteroidia bacterium]
MNKIKAGIIGGAGYTAGELIRILVNHPGVQLGFVHSESSAGKKLYEVHEGLLGDTQLCFSADFDLSGIDVLFLCGAHGRSGAFWEEHDCPETLTAIDLAQDFRDESCGYIYGLPEWRREKIRVAAKIANPGCFATAIQLGLLPLAAAGLLHGDVNITAITGSTGAGVKPSETTHFSWRSSNISAYKQFTHQHLKEIRRNLGLIQAGKTFEVSSAEGTGCEPAARLNFIPMRGDFARGIFASIHLECPLSQEEAYKLYEEYYASAPFTFLSAKPADLKQVVNTNKCVISLEVHEGHLVISSVIDNLLKGASGQAVQNMNLAFGFDEAEGLHLKASAF